MKQTRNTAQRDLIRRIMLGNKSHPTAEEVLVLAQAENPSISFGTVYRNLNLLSETGEILRLHMPDSPDHYDSTLAPHYHFLCHRCNKLQDIDLPYDPTLNNAAPEGCLTASHQLTLIGLCAECQAEIKS